MPTRPVRRSAGRPPLRFLRVCVAFGVPWVVALVVIVLLRTNAAGGLGVDTLPTTSGAHSSNVPILPVTQPRELRRISFNRDVLPILSDNCFACHGPDSASREAGLRLDQREDAIAPREGSPAAIVPGDPEASEVLRRVTAPSRALRMPPPQTGKTLSPEQIEILRAWIESGAAYEPHWSFVPPRRVDPPRPERDDFSRNAIDRFILARLRSEGLEPSREADPLVLLRRVSLDLTGLPPTPEEVDRFLADKEAGAYERAVDRMLESVEHAEHMARIWLDAARYADTHGLHLDNHREIWPWRDWVIEAYRSNMPFDRFTIEQLAGDLLPDPTPAQLIATGFNRNHVTTSEGGAIDAEYLVKYASDRVETTATVWMGLTLACAACHDHKFDPISQKEYYQLFALFNSVDSPAMDGNAKDHPPVLRVASEEQTLAIESLRGTIARIEASLDAPDPDVDLAQEQWRQRTARTWREGWEILSPTRASSTGGAQMNVLGDGSVLALGANPDTDTHEIHLRAGPAEIHAIRIEALRHESLVAGGTGRADNANFVLSEVEGEIVAESGEGEHARTQIRFIAAHADHEQMDGPYPASATIDGVIDANTGWAPDGHNLIEDRILVLIPERPLSLRPDQSLVLRMRYQSRFPRHVMGRTRVSVTRDPALHEMLAPIAAGVWHVSAAFPGESAQAAHETPFPPERDPRWVGAGVAGEGSPPESGAAWTARADIRDGVVVDLRTPGAPPQNSAVYLARTILTPTSRTITLLLGSDDSLKVWLNGRVVHDNFVARGAAPAQDRVVVTLAPGVNHLLCKVVNHTGAHAFVFSIEESSRNSNLLAHLPLILAEGPLEGDDATRLRRYFRANHSARMRALSDDLSRARDDLSRSEASLPTTLVMKELAEPRMTHVLTRGEYDKPAEPVTPAFPDCLSAVRTDYPKDRLGLALWLTDRDHPLTARVTVNRLWHQVFGQGLVRTSEDFGTQGARPSHPDLLDFLAMEFMDSGWDVRHMLRLMVTSAAYRQSSKVTPEMLARDPENRLLARGPRHRLDAEIIRDQALSASGLLVRRVGGPSVRPYQPPGVWDAVAYPDSNTRTYVVGEGEEHYRRSMYTYWKRTSPPPNLAAFDAPNRETCTVRRARTITPMQSLVMLNDPQFVEFARGLAGRALREGSPSSAIDRAFRLLLVRSPTRGEREILEGLYAEHLAAYRAAPADAAGLLRVGALPVPPGVEPAALAAMTNVCATILSLDEAVTKN